MRRSARAQSPAPEPDPVTTRQCSDQACGPRARRRRHRHRPLLPENLVVRVMAPPRRLNREVAVFTPVIRIEELEIDVLHRRVRVDGHDLHLTPLELSLLYLLATNAGRVLTRDEILDDLWGGDYVAESNVIDRQIRKLRAKLQDDWRRPRYIATVPGKGYRFVLTADQTTA